VNGWQTMDSAPLDGTAVLLWVPDSHRHVRIGWYRNTQEFSHGKLVRENKEWVVEAGLLFSSDRHEPKYWMPFPEPPK
jgi:hypothetical protein